MKEQFKDSAIIPASPQQEGVWFHALNSGAAYWNFIQKRSFRGSLDLPALKKALELVADRHASLRTNFLLKEERLFQVIRPALPVAEFFEYLKLDGGPETVQEIISKEEKTGFDFEKDVLIRFKLLECADTFVLVLTASHIITDTASMQVFWNELVTCYNALRRGEQVNLLPPVKQYFDYALEQHELAKTPAYEKQKQYWLHKLSAEQAAFDLSLYKAHATIHHEEITLPGQLVQDIRTFSLRKRVLFSSVFQLAYYILLYKITGNAAIAIGNVVNGRGFGANHYNDVIGLFAKRLVNTQLLSNEDTIAGLIARVNADLLESFANSDVTYEEVIRAINQQTKRGLAPLFQAVFNMVKAGRQGAVFSGLEEQHGIDFDNELVGDIQYDIGLSIVEQAGGTSLRLDLKCDELCKPLINVWIQRYLKILQECVYNPAATVGQFDCTPAEEALLLKRFNDTFVDYPANKTLVDLIAEQAAATPGNTAVVFKNQSLSYQQLDERSNQLAHYLRSRGVKEDSLVAICIDRSLEMIIGIVGILKAGAAYVPIDPEYPAERISYMLEDTAAEVVLTSTDWPDTSNEPTTPPATALQPHHLAYVIYTSGSTGKPKGVMNQHNGLVNRLLWMQHQFTLTASDSVLQKTTFCFDVSVWELLWPLITGARLVFAEPGGHRNTAYLKQLIAGEHITTLHFVPSMLEVFLHDVEPGELAGVKNVMCSGEELKPHQANLFTEKLPHAALHNLYGPTEAAIDVTCWTMPQGQQVSVVPIGKPVSNTKIFILDKAGQPVPIGMSGELHIGGIQVARGYLNRAELTAEKFISRNGERLYKTGDLARWLPNGNIQYLGRIDDQVKIRGYRIEPGEIASVVQQSGLVRQNVVIAKNNKLIGYAVADDDFNKEALIAYLEKQLPEYMVPKIWVKLDAIPITGNGKLDRKNLPDAELSTNEYVPPRNELETMLAATWQQLLGAERIGIHDNFFLLGGHSLLATRLVSAINKTLAAKVRIKDVFDYPTIAALVAQLQEQAAGSANEAVNWSAIARERRNSQRIPLSYSQERLWFIDQLEGSTHYHIPWVMRLQGNLNINALSLAFTEIVNRHEVLRTVLREEESSKSYQHVMEAGRWQMEILESSVESLNGLIATLIDQPFNLSADHMLRVHLIVVAPQEHILLLNIHHIAADGWSLGILMNELTRLYQAYVLGTEGLLPPLAIQYADYAYWQRQYLQGAVLEARLEYWQRRLSDVAVLELPTDYARPAVQSTKGGGTSLHIAEQLVTRLQQLSIESGATLFMTLLSVFKILLHKYSGQEDICVGTPIAGRTQQETEQLIGFFVNTLALRTDLGGDPAFKDLLQRVKTTTLESYEHQDVPFAKIVELIVTERNQSVTHLFQVMFALQNMQDANTLQLEGVSIQSESLDNKRSKFDLTITLFERATGIDLYVEFCADLFKASTIEAMMQHYLHLLEAVVAHPEKTISELRMLTASDERALDGFNETKIDYPANKTLVDLIAEQAAATPGNTAVVFKNQSLSYQQLDERSTQLAHYLRSRGVKEDSLVAICIDRSLEMIIGIVGILKAGAAYVPIDPEYPAERISYMLEDTAAEVVLTSTDWPDTSNEPTTPPATALQPHHLAYVIYTSGSTGKPKGVMNQHNGLVNRLLWMQHQFTLTASDSVLQKTTFCFDVSVWELLWPLITGARLVFAEPGGHRNTAYLKQLIAGEHITTLHFVPSMLEVFLHDVEQDELAGVKNVMCSGEELKPHQANLFTEKLPHAALHNLYGPTEAAIDVTCWTMPQGQQVSVVPIGKPVSNTKIFILDKAGQPVPIGMSGELHIGGIQVARGYLNRAELTAEKFISRNGERLYKTGDLARWLPNGNIQYLGRIDDQVKIRGYRIEPGEIASVVQQSGLVRQNVVIAKNNKLIGYAVADDDFNKEALIAYLEKQLPEYMVPRLWVKLDAIPITSNGKLDRKNLPDAELSTNEYVPPRNELETMLAATWQQLLGAERIGIHDNFFFLGGDSIVSMQVVSRIRRAGYNIRLRDIFTHQTIAKLSAAVQQLQLQEHEAEQGTLSGLCGLLPIQQCYLNRETNNPHISHYNQSMLYGIGREVTQHTLSNALQSLVLRHDALRFVFEQTAGGWQQRYGSHIPQLVVSDLSAHTKESLPHAIRSLAQQQQESLNIQQGNNLRAVLIQMPAFEKQNRLLLVIHHLVTDGVSWRILSADLELLLSGVADPGKKTSSYRQWYNSLTTYSNSQRLLAQLEYWEGIVTEARALPPVKQATEPATSAQWSTFTTKLPVADTKSLLQEVPRAYQTEINDILLAALARTLGQWSGAARLPIGLEGHGREEDITKGIDLGRTVGWFTTMYPVILEWRETETTASLIKRTKEQLRRIPGKGLGYGVLKYINKAAGLAGKDPWEIIFNYLGQYDSITQPGSVLSRANEATGNAMSNQHTMVETISVNSIVWEGELQLHWGYSTKHYRPQTIKTLAGEYNKHLQDIIHHCIVTAKQRRVFTPSDYGLGADISYQELDQFLAQKGHDNIESIYRLSALQEGMLFHSLYDEGVKAYIEQFSCDLSNVQPGILLRSFEVLLQKHSILRTAFYHDTFSIPVQCVLKKLQLPVEHRDYRTLDASLQQQLIREYETADRNRGFDLTTAPLMRVTLIRLAENLYRLVWTSHHILFDGWSHAILVGELQHIYERLIKGQVPAREPQDQYQDYIRYIESRDKYEEEQWWRNYLSGLERPVLLPFIGKRADRNKGMGRYHQLGIQLDKTLTQKVQAYIQKHRVTVNTLMQGVWAYLLYRYTGEEEITYGVTVSGRPEELPGVEDRVGLYINTLPLHVRVQEDQAIGDWLAALQASQVASRQYQYSKLSDIGKWTGLGTEMFDSILVLENYPVSKDAYSNEWSLQLGGTKMHEQTNYPLSVLVAGSQQLWISFSYNTELLQPAQVEMISGHFLQVLTQLAEEEPARLSALRMLAPHEQMRLLKDFNNSALTYPKHSTLVELFAEQAVKAPGNTALVSGTEKLTYHELDQQSSQLAHYLRKQGITEESLVMLCVDRSLHMLIGILGIMKAGGAYVPVDPEYPAERIAYMLQDTGATVVLTMRAYRQAIPAWYAGKLVVLDEEWTQINLEPINRPAINLRPGNLAYVLYTSGSTGRPKGVMITHRNVLAMLFGFEHVAPAPGTGAGLMLCPYVFDVSVWEIFLNLCFGHCLHIPVRGLALDEDYISAYLLENEIATAYIPPGQLPGIAARLSLAGKQVPLRRLLVGVMSIRQEVLQRFCDIVPGIRIINGYGPTETTICATFFPFITAINPKENTPIGRPVSNYKAYVLGPGKQLAPVGVPGELHIAGDGVGRGYLNNPGLTQEKFIANIFEPGESLLYATGDLVKWNADGNLEYLGRKDDQVKINGYRIESGEIENVLQQSGLVVKSAIVVVTDTRGNKGLAAFVVPATSFDQKELTRQLRQHLPEYMMPRLWMQLAEFPMTPNGKLDKRALLENIPQEKMTREYVAPRNAVEEGLAELLQQLLQTARVGIYDNFFFLGGNSVSAMQLASMVKKKFGLQLPVKTIFQLPYVHELAEYIDLMQEKEPAETDMAGYEVFEL